MNSINSVETDPIGLTVALFEILIPMLLFVTVKFAATGRDLLKLNRYSFCISIAVIVCTIIGIGNLAYKYFLHIKFFYTIFFYFIVYNNS